MKHFLIIFSCFLLCSVHLSAQEDLQTNIDNIEGAKELICHGAAVSIAGTIRPFFQRNFSMDQIKEMIGDMTQESIKDAPEKAYGLYKSGKNFEEVVDILKADFIKLDTSIIQQGLLKSEGEEEDFEHIEEEDDYNIGDD